MNTREKNEFLGGGVARDAVKCREFSIKSTHPANGIEIISPEFRNWESGW